MSRIVFTGLIVSGVAGLVSVTAIAQQPSPMTPANPPTQSMPPGHSMAPAASSSTYTDAQLRNYATARAAIAPMHIQVNSSMSATDRSRVSSILQQHQLTVSQYTAITERAQSDAALNARINGLTTTPASG